MPFDLEVLGTASVVGFLLVFLGGVVTSLGPCNMATIPLIVGYVGGSHDVSRSRAFVLSTTFAAVSRSRSCSSGSSRPSSVA